MKPRYIFLLSITTLFSCKNENPTTQPPNNTLQIDTIQVNNQKKQIDLDTITSGYDFSKVDKKNRQDFKENLKKIEKEYGTQWDFCTCAIKKDSVNKVINELLGNQIENNLYEVMERLDFIDKKCEAFKIQDANRTPEERERHRARVKNCLQESGR